MKDSEEITAKPTNDEQRLLIGRIGALDRTGYPFQMEVERLIREDASLRDLRWKVVEIEQHWANARTGAQGFVDLVLQRDRMLLVLELKRQIDCDWIFLGESDHPYQRTTYVATNENAVEKREHSYTPSLEAMFRALHGKSEERETMEHTCARVIDATEAIAQRVLHAPNRWRRDFAVFSVIVTNAPLFFCSAKECSVDLMTGKLSSRPSVRNMPWLRFRKQAWTGSVAKPSKPDSGYMELGRESEYSGLVVNAAALVTFLREFEFIKNDLWD